MGLDDDSLLVQRALGGDRRAFGALVERHLNLVFGIGLSVLGSREETEDLTQDVFLRAYQELGKLKRTDSFVPWLARIARNLSSDRRRAAARQAGALKRLAREKHSEEKEPGELMDRIEAERAVGQALAELPEHLRLPLVLFYLEGQSTARLAEELGLKPAAARKRLQLGRERLRRDLVERFAHAIAVLAPGVALRRRIEAAVEELPALRVLPPATPVLHVASWALFVGWIMSMKKVALAIAVLLLTVGGGMYTVSRLGQKPLEPTRPAPPQVASSLIERAVSPTPAAPAEAPAPPSDPTPPEAEPTKVLTGIVIDAVTFRPIAGAVLRPSEWDDEGQKKASVPSVSGTATGPDGRYRFAVPRSLHGMRVEKEGYATDEANTHVPPNGKDPAPDVIELVPVVPVTGWVVDQDGEPLEGARIVIIETQGGTVSSRWRHFPTCSMQDGSFKLLPSDASNRYRLAVDKAGHGGTAVDGVLPGATGITISVPPGASVSGMVLGGSGNPASGIKVRWVTEKPHNTPWQGGVLTGQDGRFEIQGLPAPALHLVFLDTLSTRYDASEALEEGADSGARKVAVQPGKEAAGIVFDLGEVERWLEVRRKRAEEAEKARAGEPPSRPGSTTRSLRISGVVKDPSSKGVPYAHVYFDLMRGGGSTIHMVTDENGTFAHSWGQGPPGSYQGRLSVDHGAFAPYRSEPFGVELPAPAEGEETVFGPYEMTLSSGFSLAGTVKDPAGLPLGGVQLFFYDRDRTRHYSLMKTTGADGRFVLEHLDVSGHDGLYLFHPDAALLEIAIPDAADGETVELGNIVLRPGAMVRGVLLRADGAPAAGYEVYLEGPRFLAPAMTDDQGRFTLEHVPPGTHRFVAVNGPSWLGGGWAPLEEPRHVTVGDSTRELSVELRLQP